MDLNPSTYGILIPANEILSRNKFEWFSRLNAKQVVNSNTIIGNYLLLSSGSSYEQGILKSLDPEINNDIVHKFVSFWKLPSDAPVWSLKPNFLGDNILKIPYAGI